MPIHIRLIYINSASSISKVMVKPKVGNPNCASKLKEEIIRNSIDSSVIGSLHPRTAINVIIQEVQVWFYPSDDSRKIVNLVIFILNTLNILRCVAIVTSGELTKAGL